MHPNFLFLNRRIRDIVIGIFNISALIIFNISTFEIYIHKYLYKTQHSGSWYFLQLLKNTDIFSLFYCI